MTTTRKWVAGAVVASLLLVTGSWFLLISPQRAQAAQLREQAATVQSANDMIRLRTQQLRAQFASLPQRRAQLAEIQQQFPASTEPSALLRQLAAVAQDAGVAVDSITPGPLQPLAAAGTTGTSLGAATGSTADVQAIATTLVVKGGYAELTLFLQKLQGSMRRAYLVESLTLTPDQVTAGAAATSDAELTLTVTGKVFVLAASAAGSAASAAGSAATGTAGTAVAPSTSSTAN